MQGLLIAAAAASLFPFGAALAQDSLQARALAATCANCHGSFGQARGDMKSLAGMSTQQITTAMAAFKAGTSAQARAATVMHQIAKGYSDEQIRLIADHYAALPVPAAQRGAP
jgi:sulfide dehydrogenase cytochrome subunit